MQTKKSINCNKQEILQSLYEDSMLFMRNLNEESDNILVLVTEFFCYIGLAVAGIFDTFCAVKKWTCFHPHQ